MMHANTASNGRVFRGATLVDGERGQRRTDIRVVGERIAEIGDNLRDGEIVDAGGLLVLPGFVDTHSHADARVFDDDVQLALLRQGVTSIIAGQDGVSFAPGSGEYATDYFGPLAGAHPTYGGGGVDALLRSYDGTSRINVGYLVPAGTVRFESMGNANAPAGERELASQVDAVREGMRHGALGLSTGLDYVPGSFGTASEIAAIAVPVAEAGGVYVTHMRGYEEESEVGFAEVEEIVAASGVSAHISHFHARDELVGSLLERARLAGADVTFDAYPYFRGSSLLSMVVLPKSLIALGNTAAGALLRDESRKTDMLDEVVRVAKQTLGAESWAARMTVASAGSAEWAWTEGLTLEQASRQRNLNAFDVALRMLAASNLGTTLVMEVLHPRTDESLARQFALEGAMVGSDGIFMGPHPHPRAYGTFARMLGLFTRDRGDFSWPEMSTILALRPVERFGLGDRGRLRAGAVADLVFVDSDRLSDAATYENPTRLATGIDTVVVGGQIVLSEGQLTARLAGRGLRRQRVGRTS